MHSLLISKVIDFGYEMNIIGNELPDFKASSKRP